MVCCYSALKKTKQTNKKELSSHEKAQRKFKCILLSEKANLKRLHTE